jgi:hypothetical protein
MIGPSLLVHRHLLRTVVIAVEGGGTENISRSAESVIEKTVAESIDPDRIRTCDQVAKIKLWRNFCGANLLNCAYSVHQSSIANEIIKNGD